MSGARRTPGALGPLFGLLLVVGLAAPALAQAPAFEGVGQAPIVGGDRVRARNRALDEAFRQAIGAAVATLLEPAALAQKQSALKLTIEPKARSYVTSYRVLEEAEQGTTFRVHVTTELAMEALERDLGGAATGKAGGGAPSTQGPHTPRIGHCLQERRAGGEALPASGVRERIATAITAAEASAAPLDAACATLRFGAAGAPALGGPDLTAAGRAALDARLDGVITVQTVARPAGPIRGTTLTGAHVEARIDIVDAGGRGVVTSQVEGDGFGATPEAAAAVAARAAITPALAALTRKLAERWPPRPAITVRLEHLERYADLTALQRTLAAVPGVIAVEPTRFSAGVADLLVRTGAEPSTILAALARPAASPSAPRFAARLVDARTIAVEVIPPPPPPLAAPTALPTNSPPVTPNGAAPPNATP